MRIKSFSFLLTFLVSYALQAQDILPPVIDWSGKSEALMVDKNHPWVTPSELSDLSETPDYEETKAWLEKLCAASPWMKMISLGKSEQNRELLMVIASKEENTSAEALRSSKKAILLAQAGIHAGEIDGKDAGLMLLRDIAFGDKGKLLDKVNLLFIPMLNVDGHERISPYNRVNQRGPVNMGWRTNAQNLNLNRDYAKLETAGVQAVVSVINDYDPDLYLDLHVTDGADYQFDITYGWAEGYSPASSQWLSEVFQPAMDQALTDMGHIPGPLMFSFNNRDFSEGNTEFEFSPRFSETYGNSRNTPSILVENHSLKPYKQRVLGTYVFLEQSMRALAQSNKQLTKAMDQDRAARRDSIVLAYTLSESMADSMLLKGIKPEMKPSQIRAGEYISWTAEPYEEKIVIRRMNDPLKKVALPKAYWVPAEWKTIIAKLKAHGIEMEEITETKEIAVDQYYIESFEMAAMPYEGHVRCGSFELETLQQNIVYQPGSVRVPMDQYKAALIALLLEPDSPDSFLQWGFMHSIFSRTEYIEEYVIEPLAEKMLAEDAELKKKFEAKKAADPAFAQSQEQIYRWFYEQSPYFDQAWKKYPIAREM
ncbi:M14 family metallopeptidase [Reichenbachiella ulvae]|uniref:M14 family metallopeptidase n=1 Tax=Reichenbachiella ulvae TaxID=2980104 RepID=A0ABT3CU05_9BACT|nr:M14 family metallopeptidase [Reichenbachiella ulvae]MCV9387038.1 M14 family metallopeptidase [Reichenbachiella ulvae]